MEKVYQIFVSSTFADLREERKQISNMLSKAGHLVAGMELFPATDQQQLEYIYRVIDRSDYYVVIVGGRYGSTADDGISFTENEFSYAQSKGIPVLAFIHSAPEKIEVGKTDSDKEKSDRLIQFKNRLSNGRLVDYWTEVNQLAANVVIAVGNAINLTPAIGWVRGDQSIDPKVIQDMERLRIENSELKAKLLQLNSAEITFPVDLLGPDDAFIFKIYITHYQQSNVSPRKKLGEAQVNIDMKIADIFLSLYDDLLREVPENRLPEILGKILAYNYFKGQIERHSTYICAKEHVERFRFHLEALGLVRATGKQSNDGSRFISWSVTEKGRHYITQFRALKRDPTFDA